jgi:hypothetical protein
LQKTEGTIGCALLTGAFEKGDSYYDTHGIVRCFSH